MGFPIGTADMRIAQYENGRRTPKADVIQMLSKHLGVSPEAIMTANVDTETGVMHTLFALEDKYGFEVIEGDETPSIRISHCTDRILSGMLRDWLNEVQKLRNGEITHEQYDNWRYQYSNKEETP